MNLTIGKKRHLATGCIGDENRLMLYKNRLEIWRVSEEAIHLLICKGLHLAGPIDDHNLDVAVGVHSGRSKQRPQSWLRYPSHANPQLFHCLPPIAE